MRGRHLAAAILALLPPLAAGAEADPPLPYASVGWLGHGGGPDPARANCSAVLIAPDIVITAEHCLTKGKDGGLAEPRTLTFIAGLSGGTSVATRRGSEIWLPAAPSGTNWAAVYPLGRLGLLRLDSPIASDLAEPLPLAGLGATAGERLTVIGYPRSDQTHPLTQGGCIVTHHAAPLAGLSCDAVSGMSGGAALALRDGGWTLGAVIVARGAIGDNVRSIALMPQWFLP